MATKTTPTNQFNPYLSGIAKRMDVNQYGGLKLAAATNIGSAKQGTYAIYGKEHLRKDGDNRAIGTTAKQTYSSRTTGTTTLDWHGKRHPIYWEDAAALEGDSMEILKENAVFIVRNQMLTEREGEIATLAITTSSYSSGGVNNYANASTKWNNASTTIMTDIATGAQAISDNTGMLPNRIFIPASVQVQVAARAPFSTQLQYIGNAGGGGNLTPYGIPIRFPLMQLEVVTLNAHYVQAACGGSNDTLADIWGDVCILAICNENWKNRSFTFMTTFTNTLGPARDDTVAMWEYDEDDVRATYVEGMEWREVKVIEPLAGYLISDCL